MTLYGAEEHIVEPHREMPEEHPQRPRTVLLPPYVTPEAAGNGLIHLRPKKDA
jgi:hypothetical protein